MGIPIILAHVESVHARGAGQVMRLGPLLPLALIVAVAVVSRGLSWRPVVRRAAAVALGAAGMLHLALFPEHLNEGLAVGLFFLGSSVAEVAVGMLLVVRPTRAVTRNAVGVVIVLLVVYAAARMVRLPFTSGPEDVDAIGVVTKAIEVLGAALAVVADRPRPPRLPAPAVLAALTLGAVALVSHPLLGEGPTFVHAAAAIVVASIVAMAVGERSPARLAVAVTDGAVLALLARGPGATVYLVLPAVAELLRAAAGRAELRIANPAAWALMLGLALPQLHARLEVLHVGHSSEPLAALTVFLLATLLGVTVWRRGQLPLTAGFFIAHLSGQALRLLADRSSFEAIEIPAASLGLFLIASFLLADPDLRGSWQVLAAIGGVAGALDVIARDRSVAYAPVIGVSVVTLLVGTWEAWRPPLPLAPGSGDLLRPPGKHPQ